MGGVTAAGVWPIVAARRAHRPRRSASATSTTDAATLVLRLAVLLQAGVSPARAWAHLAATGDPVAARVEASVSRGWSLPAAIAAIGGDDWRDVAVAWRVASVVGAPLAECLRSLASALRDAQEAADDVRVALAEPAGTARLMGWLPLVAVALGAALGFDTFATLLGQPLGIACLAGGAVLIVLARRWTSRLVAGARGAHVVPGLDAELIAIALSGGVSIDRARTVVSEAQELAASAPTGPASPATAPPAVAAAIAGARPGPHDPARRG
ncbi:type II secretion system F family protein, partial [Microbacterium arthrosphaerae]|uniref:type II secretion system F family protein n=1 Tax=Microbacterium arthrosphaerae TaxID=792652 RepID=UPI0035EBE0BF